MIMMMMLMLLMLMGMGIMEPRRSGLEHTVRNGEELERVDEFHENKQAMAFLEELERSKDTPQSIQCIDFSCFFFLFLFSHSQSQASGTTASRASWTCSSTIRT